MMMCLEAVGDEDDGECAGKGVGTPCKHKDSTHAICAQDSSRGRWECLAPEEDKMVFAVCQGQDTGTSCSFNHPEKGLTEGACYPHDDDHGGMMCGDPADQDDSIDEKSTSGALMTTAASGLGSAVIVIASFACTN
jgi:hypothetical protein